MSKKNFEYQILPDDFIRLVQLKTGPSPHISVELGVFALKTAPTFTALSYTWGGEVRSQMIHVNGTSLHITPNLESFLWEVKRRIKTPVANTAADELSWNGGWLWIDSIWSVDLIKKYKKVELYRVSASSLTLTRPQ